MSVIVLLFACAIAQSDDTQEGTKEGGTTKPTLTIGSNAPLVTADQWFQGEPIASYEHGKFYVVEVWATWCGPCILAMPHLDELAKQYAKDGLEVIALTVADSANTLESVEKFVSGRGKDFRFRYAFCEGRATYDAFMTAAGQKAIPCSFVIDRQGKIAYFGLPRNLDFVLSRIAKGTWRGQADIDELNRLDESIKSLASLVSSDPKRALEIIVLVEEINPERAAAMDVASSKLAALAQLDRFEEARKSLEELTSHYTKSKDWGGLAIVASSLASKTNNPAGKQREFALRAMKSAQEAAQEDFESLLKVAMAYRLSGDVDLFAECMGQAIAKCEDPSFKAMLEANLQQLSAPKPDSDK